MDAAIQFHILLSKLCMSELRFVISSKMLWRTD
jgi:hypothetical protein